MPQISQTLQLIVGSTLVGSAASNSLSFQWQGGRTAFSLVASVYGSGGIYLQTLMSDGLTWYNVGGPYSSNQFTSFDLPRGQYKAVNCQSSTLGVFATLSSVPYA